MQTEMQKRREQLDDIIRLCGLDADEHRVLRSQLESFTTLAVEVAHRLVLIAGDGMLTYWQERCTSAERFISGEMVDVS